MFLLIRSLGFWTREAEMNRRSYGGFAGLMVILATLLIGVSARAITPEEMQANADLILVQPDPARLMPVSPGGTRDEWFDWRYYGNVTSVKNQGGICGGCYAFASIAALETDIATRWHILTDLSEQTLIGQCPYYCAGHCDEDPYPICHWGCSAIGYCDPGGDIGRVAQEFFFFGVPPEECNPYHSRDDGCLAMDCTRWESRTYGIGGFFWAFDPSIPYQTQLDVRVALQTAIWTFGPVVASMQIFPGFNTWSDPVPYRAPQGYQCTATHAVTLVGYDNNQHCFWAKNSWGPGWGNQTAPYNQGFFRISYDEVHDPQGEPFDPYDPCAPTTSYTHLGFNSIVYDWQSTTLPPPHIEGKISGSYGPAFPNAVALAKQGSTIVDQYPADSSGNYALVVPGGTYSVTASEATGSYTFNTQPATVSTNDVQNINLTARGKYSIGGSITVSGGGSISSVTITVNGPTNGGPVLVPNQTVTGNATYSFPNLGNGTYKVTAAKSGFTFSPEFINVPIDGAIQTGKNFTATPITYSISGTVSGTSSVELALSGASSATTTTEASGNYTFSGLGNGFYTVTPSKSGYAFSPVSTNVTINGASQTGKNFVATATSFSISGAISCAPSGSSVTVNLTGSANATTTANSSNNYTYTFPGLSSGAYTVTSQLSGSVFVPTSKSVTVGPSQTGVNFIATASGSLPGDCDGDGIVSIGDVQGAVNMFLGIASPACHVDDNGDGAVSIGEVQKVINAFLGICPASSPRVTTTTPEFIFNDVSGRPGTIISIPVSLFSNGVVASAAGLDISFDSSRLSFASFSASPGVTALGFSVGSRLVASNKVRIGLANFSGAQGSGQALPTLPDGLIGYVRFTVIGTASGTAALAGTPCTIADPEGGDITSACAACNVTILDCSVSGHVWYNTAALSGVKVAAGSYSAFTDATGFYTVYVPAGTYTLTAQKSCKSFTPGSYSPTVGGTYPINVTNLDFAARDVAMCAPCFGTLDRELRACVGDPDPIRCASRSAAIFSACTLTATQDAHSVLYNATVLAISVTRHNGTPTPDTGTFTVPVEGDYFVNVTNGDQVNRDTMASSATVTISGVGEIFGHSEIKQNTPFLGKSVHLLPGTYTLSAEVWSNPGSYIIVIVSNLDFGTLPLQP